MSSCKAQVQPRGLKPRAEASTTTTRLDCCPDSRADCCPVSPWATNTNGSEEEKTKTNTIKPQKPLQYPSGLVLLFMKARHLICCQISHPSYRSFHMNFFTGPEGAPQHERHYFIAVFIFLLKQSLSGTFFSKLSFFTNCFRQFADNLWAWRICCTESQYTTLKDSEAETLLLFFFDRL